MRAPRSSVKFRYEQGHVERAAARARRVDRDLKGKRNDVLRTGSSERKHDWRTQVREGDADAVQACYERRSGGEVMALRAVPDHPKFAELMASLALPKFAVLGILEAIWHFTGRFTPQGDIGKYSDAAIETWVGWNGAPGQLIESLIKCRWVDADPVHRLLIHDWNEHADKATKNALNRSKRSFCTPAVRTDRVNHTDKNPESSTVYRLPEPEPVPEPVKTSPNGDSRTDVRPDHRPEEFANLWNRLRGPLPKVMEFTESRRRKIKVRVTQGLTLAKFEEVVRQCVSTPFLVGENDRGWQADFDWLIENDTNMTKVMEGKYENGGTGRNGRTGTSREDRIIEQTRSALAAVVNRATGAFGDGETGGTGGEDPGAIRGTLVPVRTEGFSGNGEPLGFARAV